MLKKIALTLLLVITVAVIALFAIAATRPNSFHVERSQSMAAAPDAVFAVLTDLHRFREWSPWEKLDPHMNVTYDGPQTGVGASYAWVGNSKVGEGRMTTTEATPSSSLTQKLEFLKPFKDECVVHFAIAPEGEGSRVTWSIDGDYNYLSKVMCLFVSMDKMMGEYFETGFVGLKTVVEAAPAQASTPAGSETATPAKP